MTVNRFTAALGFTAALTFALIGVARATAQEELTIHNKTGHAVGVFLFQDDKVHTNSTGGEDIQHGLLKDGASAVAHVPNCKFSIVLVDKDDVWHAEFHDCHATDFTFMKDTGYTKKK